MRRYYRRRYYRRRYRRYKQPGAGVQSSSSYNYFRVKAEYCVNVAFPSAAAGQPNFIRSDGQSVNDLRIRTVLVSTNNWASLSKIFAKYKIRGIKFDAAPASKNLASSAEPALVFVGVLHGTSLSAQERDFAHLSNSNSAAMLNLTSPTSKYIIMSEGWKNMNENEDDSLAGFILTKSNAGSTQAAGPMWILKISLYVTLKQSNI